MKRAGGGIIVAVVLLFACALGLAGRYWLGSSAASLDYGQAQRLIESLESGRVLSAKHCGPTITARFDNRAWHRLTETEQRGLMLAISRVCSERGHANPVTLHDDTDQFLADFDGRNIVR
jgi:hypothetical protein